MAQTVHLKLQINGSDIAGESTIASLGRADTVECVAFNYEVVAPREGSGKITASRQHGPVKVYKEIDKASPLLFQALCKSQVCGCEFMFFRPKKDGTGSEEMFYKVKLNNAYVSKISQDSEAPGHGVEYAKPAMETVEFVFQDIIWTYVNGGVEAQDSWKGE
jgi:type VI secretion system secreted protein Hcp